MRLQESGISQSLGTVLPTHGSPSGHGGTPDTRGAPTQHPLAKHFISFPQENAANIGSLAHATAQQLNHCRGSLWGQC